MSILVHECEVSTCFRQTTFANVGCVKILLIMLFIFQLKLILFISSHDSGFLEALVVKPHFLRPLLCEGHPPTRQNFGVILVRFANFECKCPKTVHFQTLKLFLLMLHLSYSDWFLFDITQILGPKGLGQKELGLKELGTIRTGIKWTGTKKTGARAWNKRTGTKRTGTKRARTKRTGTKRTGTKRIGSKRTGAKRSGSSKLGKLVPKELDQRTETNRTRVKELRLKELGSKELGP